MTSSETEYEKLFTKFYNDFFKFKSGKKSQLKCPGCDSNKRFIINDDKLIYACGPSNSDNPKCGKQYTITLPKYIHYRTLREIYETDMNGSLEYRKDDISQYDLSELSQKMDVRRELEIQNKLIKESSDNLKRLIDDYTKSNSLDEYIEDLEKLSEMRYKNSIEKSKIMKSLKEDELSEPEKVVLRKKYAVCIKENQGFIEIINKLNKENSDYIMIEKPDTTIHKKREEKEKKPVKENKPVKEKPTKKQTCSKAHPPPPCPPGKEVPEGKDCCYNEKKQKKPKKDSPKTEPKKDSPKPESGPKPEPEQEPKKESKNYTYDEQLKILIEYYKKVEPSKKKDDIKKIVDRRRELGLPIRRKPWLELCEKLNQKYNIHPLRLNDK